MWTPERAIASWPQQVRVLRQCNFTCGLTILFWHDQVGASGPSKYILPHWLTKQRCSSISSFSDASQVGCIWMLASQSCSRRLSLVRSRRWQPGRLSGSPMCSPLLRGILYGRLLQQSATVQAHKETWRAGAAWIRPQQMHACTSAPSCPRQAVSQKWRKYGCPSPWRYAHQVINTGTMSICLVQMVTIACR